MGVDEDLKGLEAELDDLDRQRAESDMDGVQLQKEAVLRTELAKLKANALDRASTAIFAVCLITPSMNWFTTTTIYQLYDPAELFFAVAVCLLVGFGLHYAASDVLRKGLSS